MKKKLAELILALDSVGLIFIGLFIGCLIFTLTIVELPMYVFKILGATIAIVLIASIMVEIGKFIAEEYDYQKKTYDKKDS